MGAIVDSTCKGSILVWEVTNKTSKTTKTIKIVCHYYGTSDTRQAWGRIFVSLTNRQRVRCTSPSTPAQRRLWRTLFFTTVRPAQPFWLSETLFLRVSLYFSSCPLTDNYDGPSYPRRSVLHNHYTFQRLSSMVLHINKVYVRHDRPHGPSYSRRAVTWPFVFRCYYRNVITS